MTDDRDELVARGYDEMAERFFDWAQRVEGDPRLEWFENRRLVERAGFTVVRDQIVTFVEPDHGDASFQWILAQR
jgi:hypothetical protein